MDACVAVEKGEQFAYLTSQQLYALVGWVSMLLSPLPPRTFSPCRMV